MRNENAADIYAEEQMPQEIREKIAALESVGQAKLIPKAQHETAAKLTLEDCKKIIEAESSKPAKTTSRRTRR